MRTQLFSIAALIAVGIVGCSHPVVGSGPQESEGDPAAPDDQDTPQGGALPTAACVPGPIAASGVLDTLTGKGQAFDKLFRIHSLISDGQGGAVLAVTADLDAQDRHEVLFYFIDADGQVTDVTRIEPGGLRTDDGGTQGEIMRVGDTIQGVMRNGRTSVSLADISAPEVEATELAWIQRLGMRNAYGAIAGGEFYAKYDYEASVFDRELEESVKSHSVSVIKLRTEEKVFFPIPRDRYVSSEIVLVHGAEHPWLAWIEATPPEAGAQAPYPAVLWAAEMREGAKLEDAKIIANLQVASISTFWRGTQQLTRTPIRWYRTETTVAFTIDEDGQGHLRTLVLADNGSGLQATDLGTMTIPPNPEGIKPWVGFVETDAGLFFIHSPDATEVREYYEIDGTEESRVGNHVGSLRAIQVGVDGPPIELGQSLNPSGFYVQVEGGILGARVEKKDIAFDETDHERSSGRVYLNTTELMIDKFDCGAP